MSRLHYFIVKGFDGEFFVLSPSQLHQIRRVLRLKLNDQVVCIYDNQHYLARIVPNRSKPTCKMVKQLKCNSRPAVLEITLIVAITKPKAWRMLLQKASELAVSSIVPFVGQRSVFKSSDQFRNLRVKWQKICDEATEQAQNLHRCLVQPVCTNITDIVTYRQEYNFVLDTQAQQLLVASLAAIKQHNINKIAVVVGPEGGLTTTELNFCSQNNFLLVRLGTNTLKTETAVIYACATVHAHFLQKFKL